MVPSTDFDVAIRMGLLIHTLRVVRVFVASLYAVGFKIVLFAVNTSVHPLKEPALLPPVPLKLASGVRLAGCIREHAAQQVPASASGSGQVLVQDSGGEGLWMLVTVRRREGKTYQHGTCTDNLVVTFLSSCLESGLSRSLC